MRSPFLLQRLAMRVFRHGQGDLGTVRPLSGADLATLGLGGLTD